MNKVYNCIENKELCKMCKGACCKGCGCAYISEDFEKIKFDYLDNILAQGNISIVAHLDFLFNKNGRPYTNTTLYLRVRNTQRDIVDLVSISSTCSLLKDNGCPFDFENRPTGGKVIIPDYPNMCESTLSHAEILETWKPHQNVLRKLVKKYSGLTVEEKIKKDIEELSYKLHKKEFAQTDNLVSVQNLDNMLLDFFAVFPEEIQKGYERSISYRRVLSKNI